MNQHIARPVAVLLAIVSIGAVAAANVTLPDLYGDHMILQQEAKLPVWGWAAPGEKVSVSLGGRSAQTAAGADGAWRVDLPPVAPTDAPLELVVVGNNTLKCQDVLVGELWLASGQSNMGFALKNAHNAATEIPKANDPALRFFIVHPNPAPEPQTHVSGHWIVCTPESAAGFSAVAYFFARDLRQTLHRPVGVIGSYWGGTPAQAWTSLASVQKPPALTKYTDEYARALALHRKVLAEPALTSDYEAREKKWKAEIQPAYNEAMKEYAAANAAAQAAGTPLPRRPRPSEPEPQNPDPLAPPGSSSRPSEPTVLFNGMIAPCAPYAIRGVIWYQGESDGSAGLEYRSLFPRLITGWRDAWGQGDFPFLFVQLPGWTASSPHADEWAYLREAQLKTLALPHTGMAITIDVGEPGNVHPHDKIDVGLRLARVARKVAYGQDLVSSGPLYDSMKIEGSAVRLRFTDSGGGLKIGAPPWIGPGMITPPTDKLSGFTIAADDRQWFPAAARIDGDSVLVSSPSVSHPAAVRYGWLNAPVCNLYNKEDLPASPFRTDDWDPPVHSK